VVDHGRVIRRHELSDAEWEFVGPLLPVSLRGRKRLDDREMLTGIASKFRTGTATESMGGALGSAVELAGSEVDRLLHRSQSGDSNVVRVGASLPPTEEPPQPRKAGQSWWTADALSAFSSSTTERPWKRRAATGAGCCM
jgi:hypothetical protein